GFGCKTRGHFFMRGTSFKKKRVRSSKRRIPEKTIAETSWRFPRFWLLELASMALFTHAYTTLTGAWAGFRIVSYETATRFALVESFILPFIAGLFLFKLAVWFHDRPKEANWYTDPGLLS